MTLPHSIWRKQLAAAVVALAAMPALPAVAQDQNLGAAMVECGAIRPLFERLRCYDRLTSDLAAFDTMVRETCGDAGGGLAPDPAVEAVRRRQDVQEVVAALRQGQQDLAAGDASGAAAGGQLQVVRDTQVAGVDLTPNWKVDEVRDADGNPVEVRLSTVASAPLTEGGTPPGFNILCRQRNTMMWLETGVAGSGATTAVRFGFGGDAEPVTLTMNNTANGLAMGIWSGAEEALRPMLSQSSVTASFVPKESEEMVQIGFDLTGFGEAIQVIRQQCGW